VLLSPRHRFELRPGPQANDASTCLAYYTILEACVVRTGDASLAAKIAQTREHLIGFAFELGNAIGMTEDAMLSRLAFEQEQMQTMIRNDCVNMSSLFQRHTTRCKQVVEEGDSVLLEYLK
jgi:hypothetical protein